MRPVVILSVHYGLMKTTDDEHRLQPKLGAAWEQYEKDVCSFLDELDESTVTHNVKRAGSLSKTDRQIDVLVEAKMVNSSVLIAVECKYYAKPIGIGKIDEFAGKIADLQVDRGIFYALNGVTAGAQSRAEGAHPVIEVRDLSRTAAPQRPWRQYVEEVFKLGDCGNGNCMGGDAEWRYLTQEDGTEIQAGPCPMCCCWSVKCECGEISCFIFDEETCAVCRRTYSLAKSVDGDVYDVVAAGGPTD